MKSEPLPGMKGEQAPSLKEGARAGGGGHRPPLQPALAGGIRVMPHSMEAEQGLLGCVLLDPPLVLARLGEQRFDRHWFYHLPHQSVFGACQDMWASGVPVELLSLQNRLRVTGLLEACGGLAYLSTLADVAPSGANWPYYAEEVRKKHVLRCMIRKAHEVLDEAYGEPEDVEKFASAAALDMVQVVSAAETAKPFLHVKEYAREVVDDLDEHYTRGSMQLPPGYVRTGLDYMDKVVSGIAPTDLFLLGGRPGTGKTTLAAEIVLRNQFSLKWQRKTGKLRENGRPEWEDVQGGLPVGIFSLEMSGKSIARRMLFRLAQVSSGKFKQGYAGADDIKKLVTAGGRLAQTNIWIDETPGLTISQVAAKARRWHDEHGVKLFVLDYLQLLRASRRRENRNVELEEIVDQFVLLKKALQVPWMVLTQLNRDMEKSETWRRPQLSDIRDSGAIEQACDHAFILHPPAPPKRKFDKDGQEKADARAQEEDFIAAVCEREKVDHTEWPRRVDGFEAKNRDGATGVVKLLFQCNQFWFEDWHVWEAMKDERKLNQGERQKALAAAAPADDFGDVLDDWNKGKR